MRVQERNTNLASDAMSLKGSSAYFKKQAGRPETAPLFIITVPRILSVSCDLDGSVLVVLDHGINEDNVELGAQ